jgi:hypothetical protein
MDVYVIPVARDRYELYCEPPPIEMGDAAATATPPPGLIARLRQQFATVLRAAEERQHQRRTDDDPRGWFGRAQEVVLGWLAQRIAEQRLLWNLRTATEAVAVHPSIMSFDEAMTLVRGSLERDYRRHRLWLVFDIVGLIVTAPLVVVPGPNAIGYYFAFRVVGHWLSMRGATSGVQGVTWTGRSCAALDELRDAVTLETTAREARIQDIATRLQLRHLSTFVQRVAMRHA